MRSRNTDRRSGAGLTARRRGTSPSRVASGAQVGRRSGAVTVLVAGLVLPLVLSGCGSDPKPAAGSAVSSAEPSYGTLPSYLPQSSTQVDSVLTGTASRPALTTEGDAVKVQLPRGTALVTVTGPEVPGEGLPYQSPATVCTWTVTMSGASADLPIRISDFTALDHLGNVFHPKLVAGKPKPPAVLNPGHTVNFELRTRMTVGEGLMRWAPGGGPILASWDFEVEND